METDMKVAPCEDLEDGGPGTDVQKRDWEE